MDIHQLRVFRAAALNEGFTRASEDLYMSQSTVSQHIKHLEEELGCKLFLRVGKRVVLNAAGSLLLEYSERIFHELKNAEMAVRELGAVKRGVIRVGTGASTLTYHLPRVLAGYTREFRNIELIIVTGTTEFLIQELKSDRLDMAIVMSNLPYPGMKVVPLVREELVIAVGGDSPLAQKATLSKEDLEGLPFILYQKHTAMQNLIDRYFLELRVVPRITMEMENIEAIKTLVRAGLGASILPTCALNETAEQVRALRVKGHPCFRDLALISLSRGAWPKSIQALADAIRTYFSEDSGGEFIGIANPNGRNDLLDKGKKSG